MVARRLRWFDEDLQSATDRDPNSRWNAFLQRRAVEQSPPLIPNPPWFPLGPTNIAGRILSMAFDPGDSRVVYLGSAGGGPWKSTDGGVSWRPIGDNLPTLAVGAIAVAPNHPNIIVMGTGEPTVASDAIYGLGILRSTDGGSTWSPTSVATNPDSARGGFAAIAANARTGVMLAAGREGLLRSTDDGATWITIQSTGFWTDVQWRPGSVDTAYAAMESGGLFMSVNGGLSFAHLSNGLPPDASMAGLAKIAVSPSNPDYVYAGLSAAGTFSLLGFYRSVDAGATWTLRANAPDLYNGQGFYNNTLIVDPTNPDRLFAGGVFLLRSADGGATWDPVGYNVHADHHAIGLGPDPVPKLWVGTDGGVYESGDGGDTWQDRNVGLVTSQFYSVCLPSGSKSRAYGGTQDNGMLRYSGSPAWDLRTGGDGGLCDCDPQDPLHVYGEFDSGNHFVSWDGLESLAGIDSGLVGESRFIAPFDIDPHDSQRLFTATKLGIYRSTNGGAFWEEVMPVFDVVSISVSSVSSRWVWALDRSDGIVRYSGNGGDTWSSVQAAPFAGIGGTKILADPNDSLVAYCTFLSHPLRPPLVLRTYNGGASWQDVTGDLLGQSVNTIAVDPDRESDWYVGTSVGVWFSDSGGHTWRPYGRGLPYALTLDLGIQRKARKLRAATHGRGMWEVALGGNSSVTNLNRASLILERASSNPGNGVILFRYGGRGQGPLELRVYTATGRLVSRVAAQSADGFMRTASWDTRSVVSGVYIAVLESGGSHVSRKFVVLR